MHHLTYWIALCYTSCGALAVMRNSSMGPPWRSDLTTHHTMSGYSTIYILLTFYLLTHSIILWLYGVRHIVQDHPANQSTMMDSVNYFSFQPVLHDWCNKGCGMCYPVCGIVHIKDPLLLIRKSSPCGGELFMCHINSRFRHAHHKTKH